MRHFVLAALVTVILSPCVSAQGTRDIPFNDRSVARVHTKVRFTTLIILPEGEEILDYVCGDSDVWIISGTQNLAYVKPAQTGASTNLNLVTASGRVYSFLLVEGGTNPDLKIYVTTDAGFGAGGGSPRLYSSAQVDDLRRAVEQAHDEAEATRAAASQAMDAARAAAEEAARDADERVRAIRAAYPTQLRFPYYFRGNARPFLIEAMFHDGRFTYVRTNATELPALYEVRDGVPSLIEFQVEHGVYVVPKVLERGYLAIGRERLVFDVAK